MSWMEQLENIENNIEKNNEKKIEQSPIQTKEDFYTKILEAINTYNTLLSLQELDTPGIDKAIEISKEQINELIKIAKEKYNITTQEINNLFQQNNQKQR